MSHEVVPKKNYYSIFGALLILTVVTVAVSYIDLGAFNAFIALSIAAVKALLVITFFMHVKQSSGLTKIFVAAGFFWLAILLLLIMGDYLTRDWLPGGERW